jgi:hypothetical protein
MLAPADGIYRDSAVSRRAFEASGTLFHSTTPLMTRASLLRSGVIKASRKPETGDADAFVLEKLSDLYSSKRISVQCVSHTGTASTIAE